MTAGWGETEVLMEVSSRRLAIAQHRHLPAHGLLSLILVVTAGNCLSLARETAATSQGDETP